MMMKKLFSFITITCLLSAFISCGGKGANEAVQIETSSAVMKDMSSLYSIVNQRNDLPGLAYDDSQYAESIPISRQTTETNWEGAGFSGAISERARSDTGSEPAVPQTVTAGRKLIKTTHLSIRVENLSGAAETVSAMMQTYGAYSSSTQIEENRQTYHIRVPETSYNAMLDQVNGLGKVSSRSDFVEDATLQYYDLEGRLNTRRELLQTYQSYLGKAQNIEEILSVEKKIAELQNEIDMYGSRFTQLVDQIDYATINLILYGTASGYSYEEPSIWDRVKDLFSGYGDFLSGALIVIIQIIVYGIPILAAVTLMFWLLFGKIGLLRKLWKLAAKKKGE